MLHFYLRINKDEIQYKGYLEQKDYSSTYKVWYVFYITNTCYY